MYTFKKEERLCSKRLLDELFTNGSSFLLYPFKITWVPHPQPEAPAVRVVIIVSKRRFKRAVDRNRIKRLIRETYRLNKASYSLETGEPTQILLAINYIGKDIPSMENLNGKMLKMLAKLISSVTGANANI